MLSRKYNIDVCQVYLIGNGNGADIVWYLISHYPRFFAAAIPIAGCADPYMARNAKYVPIWAFHAVDDDITSPLGSGGLPPIVVPKRELVNADFRHENLCYCLAVS